MSPHENRGVSSVLKRIVSFLWAVCIVLTAFVVLPGTVSAASFSPNIRVNAVTTGNQVNASMAVGPGGTIHVVWEDYRWSPENPAIYYARSDNGGTTFTAGIPIVNPFPGNMRQKFPSVAVSGYGYIHVVWTDLTDLGTPTGTGIHYARSTNGGISFETPVRISDTAMAEGAEYVRSRIAFDGSVDCYLHVVWAFDEVVLASDYIYLTYDESTNCGYSFGTDVLIDPDGSDASIDVSPDGNVGLAYVTGEPLNVLFKMKVGGFWQNAVQVNENHGRDNKDPVVAFDPSMIPSAVHIAWADGRYIYPYNPDTFWNWDIFYSKAANGVNFGPNVPVNDNVGLDWTDQSEPWIDVSMGNPQIAWTDWRNDLDYGHRDSRSPWQSADIFFDESSNGGISFGLDQRVNADFIIFDGPENSRPMLVVVASDVDIVWQDGRIDAYGLDIYFAGTNVPLGSPANIKINEVMFEPVCPGEQWVEFYNKDPLYVNMRGMEWTDEDSFTYSFPNAMPLVPPGAYVVVHLKEGMDEVYFGQSQPNALHLYAGVPDWERHSLGYLFEAGGVATGDYDRDGDTDIAAGEGYPYGDALYVYLHPADPTSTWPQVTVDSGWGDVWALVAGNIDLDDDLDLLAGSMDDDTPADDHVTWYENVNPGSPGGWVRHPVDTLGDGSDLSVVDVDRDGFPDLVVSSVRDQRTYWYENDGTPRDGGWTRHALSDKWGGGFAAADYDGDLYPDIFSSQQDSSPWNIGWYRNGPSEPWAYSVIETYHPQWLTNAPFFSSDDIDGDGDADVAAGEWPSQNNQLFWYENRVNDILFPGLWVRHLVYYTAQGAGAWGGIEVKDVDCDGKLDIVVTQWLGFPNSLVLYRNNLGGTPEWVRQVIDSTLTLADEISVAQIDGDCSWDVVATDNGGNALYWYTKRVLDTRDQVSLYTESVHSPSTIADFVAWGGNALDDDDNAVNAVPPQWWPDGAFILTLGILPDQTIGRDADSTDANVPGDWTIRSMTPGAHN